MFTDPLTEPAVPWAVRQPGFRIERFATGLSFPSTSPSFRPRGRTPDAPFLYVAELYGAIKVVTRSGEVSRLRDEPPQLRPARDCSRAPARKASPGSSSSPVSGDVFVELRVRRGAARPTSTSRKSRRLHSADGGRTAATQTPILQFPDEPLGASHQISNLSIGPDGKLYVHIGDGLLTSPAQDLDSVRGKILRVDLDGAPPADNPFYDGADGLTAADLVFACGLRNPFGGAWREADGALWEVENGPGMDRLAKIVVRPQLRLGRLGRKHDQLRRLQLVPLARAGQHRVHAARDVRRQRLPAGEARPRVT